MTMVRTILAVFTTEKEYAMPGTYIWTPERTIAGVMRAAQADKEAKHVGGFIIVQLPDDAGYYHLARDLTAEMSNIMGTVVGRYRWTGDGWEEALLERAGGE
jgi:hypothetical protein